MITSASARRLFNSFLLTNTCGKLTGKGIFYCPYSVLFLVLDKDAIKKAVHEFSL